MRFTPTLSRAFRRSGYLALLLLIALPGFGQRWRWATQGGGAGADSGTSAVTDPDGNVYVGGTFHGTARFGSFTLISRGDQDGFVAKLDSTGAWLWVQQLGSPQREGEMQVFRSPAGLLIVRISAGANAVCGTIQVANAASAFNDLSD
ncbi:MAG: SBBP repeat-containing protein [Hymenobacteraceae bacterium]|nr:SBBP repeat-containing protein [Hymenobacteraceae bacterium]